MLIQFSEPINASVQIGDNAWYVPTSSQGVTGNMYQTANTSDVLLIGVITQITLNSIFITSVINPPFANTFIMFSKDDVVNRSNVLGYYARIKMINNSNEKIELFAVSSEISQSSK
tara:strand:+ start:816 stop:1163 length:348 start_codon:yes stop_codon:yes gene_type:complete